MTRSDQVLLLLLRIIGVFALFALAAVVMPASWMAVIHAELGLGDLPDSPMVGYLARSLSAFYALFGGLCVFVTFDLERYRPLIRFLAAAFFGMSLVMLGVDLAVGMPWWWTAGEGPPNALGSLLIWWLARPTKE